MLKVGIHDNLVITKAAKNEKGSLEVTVKQVTEIDPMAVLNGNSVSSNFEQQEQTFLIYPPKLEGKVPGVPDSPENLLKKLGQVKDPLQHILLQYTVSSNIKWDIFAGTGLEAKDIPTKIGPHLAKIYDNIVSQFITQITPHLGEAGKKMRMLFIRQSEVKPYPKFRNQYLGSKPFIEPMTTSPSGLKYDEYDKKNKLDDPNPVGGAAVVNKGEATSAKSLFEKKVN